MSRPKAGARGARGMTQSQALAMMRNHDRVQVGATIASAVTVGLVMLMLRFLVLDDPWEAAVISSAGFAVVMALGYLVWEWVRARRMPEGAGGWTSLEPATVVSRSGRDVTIRGQRHTVVAPIHTAWTLKEGDPLWVGPAVREGETLALVQPNAGPFGTSVYSASGPARRVAAP